MPRPVNNPPNPWAGPHVDYLGAAPPARVEVFEEDAKEVLTRNDSPDVPFAWGVNPYRGCQHACAYCYARRTHEFLDWGAGSDFDTKLVVKRNAPERLAHALARRRNKGEWIAFSGVTDCYQALEASYELTRRSLEVCLDFRNPVGIITKAALIRRDVELLTKLHRRAGVQVHLSIPFDDPDVARAIEPSAPGPAARFAAMAELAAAGIPVGLAIAPVIPALSDQAIPRLLERAAAAGATSAFLILLRLPGAVEGVFAERLAAAYPDRAAHVMSALRDTQVAAAERSEYGSRMGGQGARWATIEGLFRVHCARLGLAQGDSMMRAPSAGPGRHPTGQQQGRLFD